MWPFKTQPKKEPEKLYTEFDAIRQEINMEAVQCKGRQYRNGLIMIEKISGFLIVNSDGTVPPGSYVTKWWRI